MELNDRTVKLSNLLATASRNAADAASRIGKSDSQNRKALRALETVTQELAFGEIRRLAAEVAKDVDEALDDIAVNDFEADESQS